MSNYGLQISNIYNYIIIDNNYKNYVLYDSGSTAVDGITFISFTPTTLDPVFAYSPPSGTAAAFSTYGYNGTTYSGAWVGADSAYNLDWCVYVETYTTASGYGLTLYNDDGETTLNSNDTLMVVKNLYAPSMMEGVTITTTSGCYYYVDGKSYYYVITITGGVGSIDVYAYGLKRNNDTQLEIKKVLIYNETWSEDGSGGFTGDSTSSPGRVVEIK